MVPALLLTSPANAHLRLHFDTNDARYDDLSSVRLHAYRNPDGIKMLLVNAEFFREPAPDDCCWAVWFVIDSRGDSQSDFVVHVAYDGASGGVYHAGLYRSDGTLVPVRVRATQGCSSCENTLPVHLKFGALHPSRHLRWYVTTSNDRAPDVGWYAH
jgi:hypothetical protein